MHSAEKKIENIRKLNPKMANTAVIYSGVLPLPHANRGDVIWRISD